MPVTNHEAPVSVPAGNDTDTRLLSPDECERLCRRIQSFANPVGTTSVVLQATWTGDLRWARNKVTLGGDRRGVRVTIERRDGLLGTQVTTNQLDDVSLRAAVRVAESRMIRNLYPPDFQRAPSLQPKPEVTIWSDATFQMPVEGRADLWESASQEAESRGFLAAGYVQVHAGEVASLSKADSFDIIRCSQSQFSMTVRHPQGLGSGWAGGSGYDWNQIDARAIARRAVEKCTASMNPVRIEPGRYTVILEPQAVAELVAKLMPWHFERIKAEQGKGPFVLGRDNALNLMRSKLGLRVMDERITISHNPMDPRLGIVPVRGLAPITWVDKGVLTTMTYDRLYAIGELMTEAAADFRLSYQMSGGDTSIDEMVQTTPRGLLVTRLNGVFEIDESTVFASGVTRDGLWLIENGKITKAVNNLRFGDSPLFMLNQIEQLGVPEPVFTPGHPAFVSVNPVIVPPIKARDFSFIALVDAV